MLPDAHYKYLGALAVAILLTGLVFLIIKWPRGRHFTFSQHAAAQRYTILYYILLFIIVLPLLLLFFVRWFVPTFELSIWFTITTAVSAVFQISCTLIPEIGGWRTKYHQVLAGLSAICLLPALGILATAPQLDGLSRALSWLGLASMLGIIFTICIKRGRQTSSLLLQAGYFVAFFVPILAVSYLLS